MHHLAMVLIHCLDTRIPCVEVFAQNLAESSDISLTEKGVKYVVALLGAFVKAFRTLLEFSCGILIGSDNAARIDKNPSGQSWSVLHLKERFFMFCCLSKMT